MDEAETRAELIDPKLKEAGWGVLENSKILREHQITAGRISSLHEQKNRCPFHRNQKTGKTIYQQKINDLDEMKKSILQKAFNGEL